ncbi:patatin-like phospholipase family protein, partial [Acinetobacter sp. RF14B]
MKFAHYAFIGCLGLSLAGCDKASKTPTATTPIKAREPVVAVAL